MNATYQIEVTGLPGREVGRLIREIAFTLDAEIKISGSEPKHGPTYPRPGGRSHTASAPGESPAIDTGFLHNSIQVDIRSNTEAVILIPPEYAEALEFGTATMAARPFVRPAIDSVTKRFDSGGFLSEGLS
jgi:hypothetical protein